MTPKETVFNKLNINNEHKLILSLDGGGVRSTIIIEQLKKLEEVAGIPCYELFDMIAGTSGGAIIGSLILSGYSAKEISEIYEYILFEIFAQKNSFSNILLNPPLYSKKRGKRVIEELLGKETTLEQACLNSSLDFLCVARDVWAGEQVFFSCFQDNGNATGAYKKALLRGIVEASSTPPIIFNTFERFIDGAFTAFNSPALPALMEAIHNGPEGKYDLNKITIFSFGSGIKSSVYKVKDDNQSSFLTTKFWMNWFLNDYGEDVSRVQTILFREKKIFPNIDYRRFQLSLEPHTLRNLTNYSIPDGLPGIKATCLHDLTIDELKNVTPINFSLYPLLKLIGEAMAEFIEVKQKVAYSKDLVGEDGMGLLIPKRGDISMQYSKGDYRIILENLSNSSWIDTH